MMELDMKVEKSVSFKSVGRFRRAESMSKNRSGSVVDGKTIDVLTTQASQGNRIPFSFSLSLFLSLFLSFFRNRITICFDG